MALGAGAISYVQPAAMVIGMDIGTTFTAVLATVGGSTATRQTGFAHVIYNLLTGIFAFFLLGPFSAFIETWIIAGGGGNTQIALVGFHTTFNIVGVVLLLPFAHPFARLVVWLVPERSPPLLRRLFGRSAWWRDGAANTNLLATENRFCRLVNAARGTGFESWCSAGGSNQTLESYRRAEG